MMKPLLIKKVGIAHYAISSLSPKTVQNMVYVLLFL